MRKNIVAIASSSYGYKLVCVNGWTVARVKTYAEIDESKMLSEQLNEWKKTTPKEREFIKNKLGGII